MISESNGPLAFAAGVVVDAARVARAVQAQLSSLRELTKDDRSPVTVADFAVQAIVAHALRERWGEVLLVGEEHAELLRQPQHAAVLAAVVEAVRSVLPALSADSVLEAIDSGGHDASGASFWTLDPVDGTKGFLRGEQYAVALARIDDGEVTLAAMACPNLPCPNLPCRPNLAFTGAQTLTGGDPSGSAFVAAKGTGAWQMRCISPLGARDPIHCRQGDARAIRLCESVEASHSSQEHSARLLAALGLSVEVLRIDSQCKYALVARGQADVYLRMPKSAAYVEKIWDHAAGMLIATEAGAAVSDITGAPLSFRHGRQLEANRGIVCAPPSLHARLIEAIDALPG